MKEMSTIYNLFYDGLPKELQDHIYSFDDTYINLYNKALFRNEIQYAILATTILQFIISNFRTSNLATDSPLPPYPSSEKVRK